MMSQLIEKWEDSSKENIEKYGNRLKVDIAEMPKALADEIWKSQNSGLMECSLFILNDDETPMDYVVKMLKEYFFISYALASKLMIDIHSTGEAEVFKSDLRLAETVKEFIEQASRIKGYPLSCEIRKA